jgi:hypothetical protein
LHSILINIPTPTTSFTPILMPLMISFI